MADRNPGSYPACRLYQKRACRHGCRFNVYKDQRENLEEYLADVSYEKSETEYETLYTYVKEGYGEQVLVNPFGDVWKIAMTDDASSEKLNAIRTLLEDHSWHKQ